ncbi:protein amnionless isoform X2 [Wyeomyia smithii]|uniref:protein amnionless isoform X2 n=1 Tax=Wyeomyia smithii TaxID=174621 RepID=UPI002467E466|nr:protein amnionless isoform X2 [Wyeomyia smithii]XP_055538888.1 protein amnionless isoform X2 [Wyeomyia smithii]XP_055538889.1 protein amnionless isoform X2 [Wyeomyia smithii]
MLSLKSFLIAVVMVQMTRSDKVWRHNLNFDNPNNWIGEKVPKAGNSIRFPAKLNALVTLPDATSMHSMILPQSGVILLPERDFSLVFADESKQREESSFKVPQRRPYYSASSWKQMDTGNNERNRAVPHTEKIPCQYETAVFPESPTPIDLQYHQAIEVKDVKFANTQGLDEFRRFLSTELGQLVIYNGEETLVREGKCASPEKCPCQPDWVKEAVCANEVCDVPLCLRPIVPIGHCCALCGSMLTMDLLNFGGKFVLAEFAKKLERKIAASEVDATSINWHVSVQNDALQLLVVDAESYDEKSIRLMQSLEPFFMKQFLNGHKILHSGHPHVPYQSGQLFMVTFLSLLVISIFFTTIYVYYYDDTMIPRVSAMIRNRQFFLSPFVFARFDPTNDESAVDINFTPSGVENINSAFNNPMFEEASREASVPSEGEQKVEQESYVDVELKSHE